ncbi:MAG TPA: hypothetical protein V6C72_05485, partial [Chroococcales cyanobacterium]
VKIMVFTKNPNKEILPMTTKTSALILAAFSFLAMVALQLTFQPPGLAKNVKGKAHAVKGKAAAKSAEDRAIELVEAQKDVKEWLKQFPNGTSKSTGGHPGFMVDPQGKDVYSVKVSEDKEDQDVTFGFYTVNLKTGKVTKEE